jgi:hypothetical protein
MTLSELKSNYTDTPEFHKHVHELFIELVNGTWGLNDHRTYVENNVFGMGERSFWWVWKLILEELPANPKLLEIGVFKAASLSLWKMLREDAQVFGVTPLDGRGTGWTEDDYWAHIQKIHNDFGLPYPKLFIGGSEEPEMIQLSLDSGPYDVIYVDGNHSHNGALSDLNNYSPMVKSGGWLIVDDAACRTSQPFGYFQGISSVCDALEEWESTEIAKEFDFQFNVVHLMCYKRI